MYNNPFKNNMSFKQQFNNQSNIYNQNRSPIQDFEFKPAMEGQKVSRQNPNNNSMLHS